MFKNLFVKVTYNRIGHVATSIHKLEFADKFLRTTFLKISLHKMYLFNIQDLFYISLPLHANCNIKEIIEDNLTVYIYYYLCSGKIEILQKTFYYYFILIFNDFIFFNLYYYLLY